MNSTSIPAYLDNDLKQVITAEQRNEKQTQRIWRRCATIQKLNRILSSPCDLPSMRAISCPFSALCSICTIRLVATHVVHVSDSLVVQFAQVNTWKVRFLDFFLFCKTEWWTPCRAYIETFANPIANAAAFACFDWRFFVCYLRGSFNMQRRIRILMSEHLAPGHLVPKLFVHFTPSRSFWHFFTLEFSIDSFWEWSSFREMISPSWHTLQTPIPTEPPLSCFQ